MGKHSMNAQELRQRIRNISSIRDGIKSVRSDETLKAAKMYRIKLRLDEELQDVRTIYYARVKEERENYRQNMAGL